MSNFFTRFIANPNNAPTNSTSVDEMHDYVMRYYGPGGLYDMGVTSNDAILSIVTHIRQTPFDFDGDTYDRECVRDILIKSHGYKWPSYAPTAHLIHDDSSSD